MSIPFLISLIFSLITVWLAKISAVKFGILDLPDGQLKPHEKPIPVTGGIGILIAFVLSLFIYTQFQVFIIPIILLALLGLVDDFMEINSSLRLVIEFLLALLTVYLLPQQYGLLTDLLIAFFITGSINAVNMQDGLDGLAAGLVFISSLAVSLTAYFFGSHQVLVMSIFLAGSVLGFLFFNYHPAKIFMGDNGSYFIGGLIAVLLFLLVNDNLNPVIIIGIIFIIGTPVFDAIFAFIRRIYNGKSPFAGDRSHFYDLLVQKGFSVKKTVNLIYVIQLALCSFGILIILDSMKI